MAGEQELQGDENESAPASGADADFSASFDDFSDAEIAKGNELNNEGPTGQNNLGQEDGLSNNSDANASEENNPEPNTEDIDWANVPPELKARMEKLENERKAAIGRAVTFQHKAEGLERTLSETQEGTNRRKQSATEEVAEALKSDQMKEFQEEYPEVAEPLVSLTQTLAEQVDGLNSRFNGLEAGSAEAELAQAENAFLQAHPDGIEIAHSDEFQTWVSEQPAPVQRALADNADSIRDAESASWLLGLYKREHPDAFGRPQNESGNAGNDADSQNSTDPAKDTDPRADARNRRLNANKGAKGGGATVDPNNLPPNGDDFESNFEDFADRQPDEGRRYA